MSSTARNPFYIFIGMALSALVLVGFARTYYLRPWFEGLRPITVLLHAHSIVFTAWFALFVIQTRLIAAHKVRTHMQLGLLGVGLAVLVVIVSLVTTVVSANAVHQRPMGMNSAQFILMPLTAAIFFGILVAAAVAMRRNPAWHKRLMTLAMISVLGPPVARLILVSDVREHFLAIQTIVPALFVIWCLVSDWVKHRIVHPVYAIGGTFLVIAWPLRAVIARTAEWESVGRWIAGLTA